MREREGEVEYLWATAMTSRWNRRQLIPDQSVRALRAAEEPNDVREGVLRGVEHDREKVEHVHRVEVAVVVGEPTALDEQIAAGVRHGESYSG
jgi:hypothetical protein